MIFTNPCKDKNSFSQLKKYVEACLLVANHTCTHPRLDDVGFSDYSKDAEKADQLLSELMSGQKFFRFPFLNESKDEKLRDQMRNWSIANNYRNGLLELNRVPVGFVF